MYLSNQRLSWYPRKLLIGTSLLGTLLVFLYGGRKQNQVDIADLQLKPDRFVPKPLPQLSEPPPSRSESDFDPSKKEIIRMRKDAILFKETRTLFDRHKIFKSLANEWIGSARGRSLITKIVQDFQWTLKKWGSEQAEVRVFALEALYELMKRGDLETVEQSLLIVREDLRIGKVCHGRREDFAELLSYYLEGKDVSTLDEVSSILETVKWDRQLLPLIYLAIARTPKLAHFIDSMGSQELSRFLRKELRKEE